MLQFFRLYPKHTHHRKCVKTIGTVRIQAQRMLKRGPLQRKLMKNLKVYKGPEHPHAAQNPEALDVAKLNPKNARG